MRLEDALAAVRDEMYRLPGAEKTRGPVVIAAWFDETSRLSERDPMEQSVPREDPLPLPRPTEGASYGAEHDEARLSFVRRTIDEEPEFRIPEHVRMSQRQRYNNAVAAARADGGVWYDLYCEGYRATCEHGNARYMGKGIGASFSDAVLFFFEHDPTASRFGEVSWDPDGTPRVWACRIFSTLSEAKQSYG